MGVAEEILARPEVDSFWRMGESGPPFVDEVGDNDWTIDIGAFTEGQPSIVPGTSDTSVLHPHDGSRLTCGDVYDFTGSAAFTAYAWIKPVAFDSINGNYMWGNQDASARGWSLGVNFPASTFTWQLRRGDDAGHDLIEYQGMTEAEYENGVAKQVAMSYDGTNLILNINGVDVHQAASSKSLVAPTTNTALKFGTWGGTGSSFDGYFQYLAIFSPNLSAANLLEIYNSGFKQTLYASRMRMVRR